MAGALNKEDIIVQISTGGYQERGADHARICGKLDGLLGRIPVSKVIIGWSCGRAAYEQVIAYLRPRGIECYLWLPVFSETGVLKEGMGKLVDDAGSEVRSYRLAEGENFEFYCPNRRRNIDAFFEIYRERFDGLGFDGVFLDKIRYGSFSNGLGGVFGCFCPSCMRRYGELGMDAEGIKGRMGLVRRGEAGYGERPLGILSYEKGRYRFEDPAWEAFFRKKADDIAMAMETVAAFFRGRGMKVGMDTFAPYLAYFVGQDLERLAPLADFIKPMMYRITNAPAGMPFETDCLIRETIRPRGSTGDGGAGRTADADAGRAAMARGKARERYFRALGCRDRGGDAFDLEFTAGELAYAAGFGTPVYGGIEVNQNAAAPSTPGYIRETMGRLRDVGIEGYVLSWDVMSATEGSLAAVERHLGGRRREGRC